MLASILFFVMYIMVMYYWSLQESEKDFFIICQITTCLALIYIIKYSYGIKYLFKGALCGIILTIAIYIGLIGYIQAHIEYLGGIVATISIIMLLVQKSLKQFFLSLVICAYTHLLSLLVSLYFDGYYFVFRSHDDDNFAAGILMFVISDIHIKVIVCFVIIALILTIKQILNKKT